MRVVPFLWEALRVTHHLHHVNRGARCSGLGIFLHLRDDDGGSPDGDNRTDQGSRGGDDHCLSHLLSPVPVGNASLGCPLALSNVPTHESRDSAWSARTAYVRLRSSSS